MCPAVETLVPAERDRRVFFSIKPRYFWIKPFSVEVTRNRGNFIVWLSKNEKKPDVSQPKLVKFVASLEIVGIDDY